MAASRAPSNHDSPENALLACERRSLPWASRQTPLLFSFYPAQQTYRHTPHHTATQTTSCFLATLPQPLYKASPTPHFSTSHLHSTETRTATFPAIHQQRRPCHSLHQRHHSQEGQARQPPLRLQHPTPVQPISPAPDISDTSACPIQLARGHRPTLTTTVALSLTSSTTTSYCTSPPAHMAAPPPPHLFAPPPAFDPSLLPPPLHPAPQPLFPPLPPMPPATLSDAQTTTLAEAIMRIAQSVAEATVAHRPSE